jgi:hypothetical protein
MRAFRPARAALQEKRLRLIVGASRRSGVIFIGRIRCFWLFFASMRLDDACGKALASLALGFLSS